MKVCPVLDIRPHGEALAAACEMNNLTLVQQLFTTYPEAIPAMTEYRDSRGFRVL